MTDYSQKVSDSFNYMMFNAIGGPKFIQLRWVINTFKFSSWIFALGLMYFYQNFSLGAVLYVCNNFFIVVFSLFCMGAMECSG